MRYVSSTPGDKPRRSPISPVNLPSRTSALGSKARGQSGSTRRLSSISLILAIILVSFASICLFLRSHGDLDGVHALVASTRLFAEGIVKERLPHSLPSYSSITTTTPRPASSSSTKLKPTTTLGCHDQYEPTCEMYNYLRFWNREFVEADCYQSPLRIQYSTSPGHNISRNKFLLFEPDRGGWNNIRMAAETAMIIAHASGRTLVLPPEERWYLLDSNKKKTGIHDHLHDLSTFNTFFDLSKLTESIDVISMKEYMEKIALGGLLSTSPDPEKVQQLGTGADTKWVWKYLEQTSYVRQWEPGKMFLAFNLTEVAVDDNHAPTGDVHNSVVNPDTGKMVRFGHIKYGRRAKLLASHDRKLIPYDKEMDSNRAIFFPGDYRNTHRILTHFYSYIHFAEHRREHFYKRFVRDRLHYHDEIFCAASKVLRLIHEDAARISGQPLPRSEHNQTLGGDTTEGASFFAFHIRRGDFQFKETRLPATEIWENTKHLLDSDTPNNIQLIYIATDEKDKNFFAPFKQGFEVRFLENYYEKAGLSDLNQNHIGMIEQIVCANAHTFIGTPRSTFTGYITRMRGYYRDDRYSRTFYTLDNEHHVLHSQTELKGPFWAREFKVAHHEIDDDSVQRRFRKGHSHRRPPLDE